MEPVLIDSNVLLDIITQDPQWAPWSKANLTRLAERRVLVLNPIVFAEVSVRFDSIEELETRLPPALFRREPLPWEGAFLAGRCFLQYRRRGGLGRAPLPDFYIGAHAAIRRYSLLTRDYSRYRTYFPTLDIIAPAGPGAAPN